MAEKRTIDINIKNNADEATKDFNHFNDALDQTAKSAKNVNSTFEEVYGELQPLTTRLGEAEDRLYELALAGDTTSKEYQELLNKVAEYRKVQIKTDEVVDGAAQTMTQKLGSALNGVTSGFAATQGAMALFGSENEALEKSLLKVQGALAIQQGVQGLTTAYRELTISTTIASAAQSAFAFVTGGATTALKVLRVALITTGIGALIAGVALLVANFGKVKKAIEPAIQGLKDFGDWIGVTSFAEEEMAEKREKRAVANEKRLQKEIDNLKEIKDNIDKNTQAYLRQLDAEIVALEQSKEGLKNKEKIAEIDEQIRQKNIEGIEKEYNAFKETQQLKLKEYEKEIQKNQNRIDAAKARGSSQYKTELFYVKKYTAEANKLRQELNTNNFTEYQEYLNKLEAVDIERAKKEKADQKASNDRYKNYLKDRLDASRKIEDLENELLEEGIEKELEINRDKFRRLREDAEKNTKLTLEERKRLNDLYTEQQEQSEAKIREKYDQKEIDEQLKLQAEFDKIKEENEARFRTDEENELNAVAEKYDVLEAMAYGNAEALNEIEIARLNEENEIKAKFATEAYEAQKALDDKAEEDRKARQEKEIADAKAAQQAKIQFANDAFGAIGELANAFAGESEESQRRAFKINKAVGIAQAIVNTAGAISAAINPAVGGLGIPAGLPGAALAAATGAAQIATIAKTKFQGGSSGDVSSPSEAGLGEAVTPQFNVVGESGVNQLAQLQQPTQAYVVSGDVTSAQALDRNRVQNATL